MGLELKLDKRTYRLTGLEPILGTQPADPEIRAKWLATKAPTEQRRDLEIAEYDGKPDEDHGLTTFIYAPCGSDGNGHPTSAVGVYDYSILGFLKNTIAALGEQSGVKNGASKSTKYLFVFPRRIPIMRDGAGVKATDYVTERPLRTSGPTGVHTALAASDTVHTPWYMDVEIVLLPNPKSKTSGNLTWDVVEQALDYGMLKGLGQWRNASYGRFTWELIKG